MNRRWAWWLVSLVALVVSVRQLAASPGLLARWLGADCAAPCDTAAGPEVDEQAGTWYWLRSPDEEHRAIMGLFNRYCIRCHGVDGRGVWDIPDVPNFTNPRWQASRADGQLARIIREGRGAVMPPFRGTLSLEEAWAMARYLRTFVPGTEASRPDLGQPPASSKTSPPKEEKLPLPTKTPPAEKP